MSRGRPYIATESHRAEREFRAVQERDRLKLENLERKIEAAKQKRLLKLGMETQRP
ncbi:hypothetical protein [Dongia sp. agr-C8]